MLVYWNQPANLAKKKITNCLEEKEALIASTVDWVIVPRDNYIKSYTGVRSMQAPIMISCWTNRFTFLASLSTIAWSLLVMRLIKNVATTSSISYLRTFSFESTCFHQLSCLWSRKILCPAIKAALELWGQKTMNYRLHISRVSNSNCTESASNNRRISTKSVNTDQFVAS